MNAIKGRLVGFKLGSLLYVENRAIFFLFVLILATALIGILVIDVLNSQNREDERPILVLRVDDIQDYAFKEAQLLILNYSIENKLPLSLGIITGLFGSDTEIVEAVKSAVAIGSEVNVHGWQHENLAELSLDEQRKILFNAKTRMREILNVTLTILTPPMFSFNNNTLIAMKTEGFTILSTCSDLHNTGVIAEKIINIPATVELSKYANGTWTMKSKDLLTLELERSVQTFGYAVLVTHPQEFIKGGVLDKKAAAVYIELIRNLQKTYQFKTLEALKKLKYG